MIILLILMLFLISLYFISTIFCFCYLIEDHISEFDEFDIADLIICVALSIVPIINTVIWLCIADYDYFVIWRKK